MKKYVQLLLIFAACGVSGSVLAGAESGFYVGGSIGTAEVDYSDSDPDFEDVEIDFNDDDSAYKVFAGYNFGILPLLDLAVEGSYVDFGKMEDDIEDVAASIELDALTLSGVVGVTLGPVGLFAKAGMVSWDGDVEAFSESDSESGTDPMYGVGAKLQFGSLAVRAEYEWYDLDEIEVDYYSVGLAYTF